MAFWLEWTYPGITSVQFKPDLACARITISYLEDRRVFREEHRGKVKRDALLLRHRFVA